MIIVHLMRSGIHGKHLNTAKNLQGVFTKKFTDIEALVYYMRAQRGSVYLAPYSGLSEKNRRLFISKYKAMWMKKYPSIDHKINKEITRRQSLYTNLIK